MKPLAILELGGWTVLLPIAILIYRAQQRGAAKRGVLLLLAALTALLPLKVATLMYVSAANQPPIVQTKLADFDLQSAPGETAHVSIYKVERLSNGWNFDDLFQNRIEASFSGQSASFEWPRHTATACDRVLRVDLNGDGTDELLFECTLSARVVHFHDNQIAYREGLDLVRSWYSGSAIEDLDGDKAPEIIATSTFPDDFGYATSYVVVPLPKIYRWDRSNGLRDVSGEFPVFFRLRVRSKLLENMAVEERADRRALFAEAIKWLDERFPSAARRK